jgi:hypothetical protein
MIEMLLRYKTALTTTAVRAYRCCAERVRVPILVYISSSGGEVNDGALTNGC